MAKHFLYLTNDKMLALIWRAGGIVERDVFGAADAESPEFEAYLAGHADVPVYLITDLIEEDFRTDTVPHLRGGDQEAVLSRKLAQLYRASTFRHAIVQEREAEGRRDDRVLYHAITNPDLVKPWIAALDRAGVPLEAISASAVLSVRLPKELGVFFTHTLLVTIVPDFGLRQTYFQNRQIKFSRLTPIIYDEGQSVGTLIAAETSRTWQYLDSLRYFAGGDTLEVCIMVHARDREMVAEAIRTYPLLKYRFLDIEEVAARLKLKPAPVSSHAEEVLVHLYAQGRIENHFAERDLLKFARYRRMRLALYGLTASLLVVGALGAAFNLYQAASISAEIDKRNPIARGLQSEYQAVSSEMSQQKFSSETVKDASAFYRAQMRPAAPAPGPAMRDIAMVWRDFPALSMLQVVWAVHQEPGYSPPLTPYPPSGLPNVRSEAPKGGSPSLLSTLLPGNQPAGDETSPPLPGSSHDIAIIEGAVTRFSGDYRAAIAEVQRLLAALNASGRLQAQAVNLPVDAVPANILRGKVEAGDAPQVRFVIRVSRARNLP